jgi:excisionase family DNA binding protein
MSKAARVAYHTLTAATHSSLGTMLPIEGALCYAKAVEYVTVQQAADELGLSVWGIRDRIQRGDMRAERLGQRMWVIPVEEVARWKELGRQRAGRKPRKERD